MFALDPIYVILVVMAGVAVLLVGVAITMGRMVALLSSINKQLVIIAGKLNVQPRIVAPFATLNQDRLQVIEDLIHKPNTQTE